MTEISTVDELSLNQIQRNIDRMPSLSVTVTKVLEVCDKPNTSPNDLNQIISLDPVLTGQVLKLINSAYYSLPNRVTSLTRAIIMLGLNTVKNLALSTAVLGSVGQEESFQHLPIDLFWTHSLGTGVAAKTLAVHLGVSKLELEEYFVGGLLHDLGKIPLSSCFGEKYKAALDAVKNEHQPLHEAETRILGLNHLLVGQMIAEKWRLPDTISDSLAHHHQPAAAAEKNRRLVTIVGLANIFANKYEIGSAGELYRKTAAETAILKALDLSWPALAALKGPVQEELENARVFLQVSGSA